MVTPFASASTPEEKRVKEYLVSFRLPSWHLSFMGRRVFPASNVIQSSTWGRSMHIIFFSIFMMENSEMQQTVIFHFLSSWNKAKKEIILYFVRFTISKCCIGWADHASKFDIWKIQFLPYNCMDDVFSILFNTYSDEHWVAVVSLWTKIAFDSKICRGSFPPLLSILDKYEMVA